MPDLRMPSGCAGLPPHTSFAGLGFRLEFTVGFAGRVCRSGFLFGMVPETMSGVFAGWMRGRFSGQRLFLEFFSRYPSHRLSPWQLSPWQRHFVGATFPVGVAVAGMKSGGPKRGARTPWAAGRLVSTGSPVTADNRSAPALDSAGPPILSVSDLSARSPDCQIHRHQTGHHIHRCGPIAGRAGAVGAAGSGRRLSSGRGPETPPSLQPGLQPAVRTDVLPGACSFRTW